MHSCYLDSTAVLRIQICTGGGGGKISRMPLVYSIQLCYHSAPRIMEFVFLQLMLLLQGAYRLFRGKGNVADAMTAVICPILAQV